MFSFVTLPGIGGSGPAHWQTRWEAADPAFRRFQPSNWDEPDIDDWIAALDRAVMSADAPVVLVAHSLACLLVAHWARRSSQPVAGAFLVSVPDPEGCRFPLQASAFAPVPASVLRCPALVIASNDDPYGTAAHAQLRSRQWEAGHIEVGPLGHINAASGLGDWPQGRMLLSAFCAGLSPRRTRPDRTARSSSSTRPAETA